MEEQFGGAQPGRGHRALASLYRAGKVARRWSRRTSTTCIKPLALLPNTSSSCTATRPTHCASIARRVTNCLGCEQRFEARQRPRADLHGLRRPHQDRDGLVRPGDARRRDAARGGTDAVCDLFLAIGSSLVVWPAAGFPLMAKRNGAQLGHHQSRADRVRRHRRSRRARGHRRRARTVHHVALPIRALSHALCTAATACR